MYVTYAIIGVACSKLTSSSTPSPPSIFHQLVVVLATAINYDFSNIIEMKGLSLHWTGDNFYVMWTVSGVVCICLCDYSL